MKEIETTITAVTVYPDRARLTRQGTVALQPGSYSLVLTELPLTLDPASARVAARGTARARLLGLDVRREFYVETPDARVRELEKQVERLQDEVQALEGRAALLKEDRAAIRGLLGATEQYARGLALGKTTADEQMKLLDGLSERARQVDAALLALAAEQREAGRRLKKAQAELEQLRSARGRERYAAVVEVEVSQPGDLTVELTYVVSRAGWTPLYDVRMLEGEKAVLEIGYLAQVTQQTGEAWKDVALTLSTARPALAEKVPELDPWFIDVFVPPPPAPSRMAKMAMAAPQGVGAAADVDFSGRAPEPEAVEEEADVAMAAVESSGTAVTYVVPGTVTIPPDGAPHKVAVARLELTPQVDYVTAPKLVEAAYRHVEATNDSPYTFLPGPASLFAGDEFIGSTTLELTAPGGRIELYLGADDRIRVKRELKRREVDKKLIGDRRTLRYGYEIELENLLPVEALVNLQDQIPVARHESIKVRLDFAEPGPEQQSELGLLDWKLALAAGKKQLVRFDFTVEHPRDKIVKGLP